MAGCDVFERTKTNSEIPDAIITKCNRCGQALSPPEFRRFVPALAFYVVIAVEIYPQLWEMKIMKLADEDHPKDAAFSNALHRSSITSSGGLMAICKKNPTTYQAVVDEYLGHWENTRGPDGTEDARLVCK